MFEVITISFVMVLVAMAAFLALGYSLYSAPTNNSPLIGPNSEAGSTTRNPAYQSLSEDSALKRYLISTLEAEVRTAISFQPSDFMLEQHDDALVAVEVNRKLEAFAYS